MNHWLLVATTATLGALGASLYLYLFRLDALDARIPIHWGISGQPDGWMRREYALFVMPPCMALILVLAVVLPWISPRPFLIEGFRPTWDFTMALVGLFFGYIHAVMLFAGLRPEVDSGRWLIGGLFLFFALLGNVLGKVRRNFWAGVRTPWTLASDKVWNATHRLAGYLFVAAGLIGFVGVVAGMNLIVAFVLIISAGLVPVFYSLWLYKHLEKLGQLDIPPSPEPVGEHEQTL